MYGQVEPELTASYMFLHVLKIKTDKQLNTFILEFLIPGQAPSLY